MNHYVINVREKSLGIILVLGRFRRGVFQVGQRNLEVEVERLLVSIRVIKLAEGLGLG